MNTMFGARGGPDHLLGMLQQSATAAKDLQLRVEALADTETPPPSTLPPAELLAHAVHAHASHVLTHDALLSQITENLATTPQSSEWLTSMVEATDKMLDNARKLQEHVIVSAISYYTSQGLVDTKSLADRLQALQVDSVRGKNRRTNWPTRQPKPNPPNGQRRSNYRKPSVEDSDDDKPEKKEHDGAADVPEMPTAASTEKGRDIKPLKKRKAGQNGRDAGSSSSKAPKTNTNGTKTPSTSAEQARNSPKRGLEPDAADEARGMLKRTKLSPDTAQTDKRKSDVSMLDAEERYPESFEVSPSPEPSSKRQRIYVPEQKSQKVTPQQHPSAPRADHAPQSAFAARQAAATSQQQFTPQPAPQPKEEYEDISAEVEARMRKREARKEHERKQELGIAEKRKRQSGDSLTVDLDGQNGGHTHGGGGEVEKRRRKKKKHRHEVGGNVPMESQTRSQPEEEDEL